MSEMNERSYCQVMLFLQHGHSRQSLGLPSQPSGKSVHSATSWIWRSLHQSATIYNVVQNIEAVAG